MFIDEALERFDEWSEQLELKKGDKHYKKQRELATLRGERYDTYKSRLKTARSIIEVAEHKEKHPKPDDDPAYKISSVIPTGLKTPFEILNYKQDDFIRQKDRLTAKEEVKIHVYEDIVGYVVFGDIHIDDQMANVPELVKDICAVQNNKPYVRGILIGDHLNNWVGRLSRLFEYHSTTGDEAWKLVEWIVSEEATNPIIILSGNHGQWSGTGDPVKWMAKPKQVIEDDWGIRTSFIFENGKEFKMYNKHNFKGTSIYNKSHGILRAAMFGAGRGSHVYMAGHLHTGSVWQTPLEDTGVVVWSCRAKGYKYWDSFAHERLNIEFDATNIGAEAIFVMVDSTDDGKWSWIQCFADVQTGIDVLRMKRLSKGLPVSSVNLKTIEDLKSKSSRFMNDTK